jgi:hypothetical protein
MAISCNCEVTPRVYSYGNSTPEIPVGDQRKRIEDEEYLNDQTIGQMDLPVCESIGTSAFEASSITGIYAPKCTTVEDRAFYNCDKMLDVDLSGVNSIGSYAFYGIHVESDSPVYWDFSGVSVIKDRAFHSVTSYSQSPIIIDISSVKEVGYQAFRNASFWSKADTPKELILPYCETIADQGFFIYSSNDQSRLTLLDLPSIKTIGDQAFRCIGNEGTQTLKIRLGPNCTYIGPNAFYDWQDPQYTDIYCYATTPPTLGGYFDTTVGSIHEKPRKIYVPAESVDLYKAARYWTGYSDRIEAIPT